MQGLPELEKATPGRLVTGLADASQDKKYRDIHWQRLSMLEALGSEKRVRKCFQVYI